MNDTEALVTKASAAEHRVMVALKKMLKDIYFEYTGYTLKGITNPFRPTKRNGRQLSQGNSYDIYLPLEVMPLDDFEYLVNTVKEKWPFQALFPITVIGNRIHLVVEGAEFHIGDGYPILIKDGVPVVRDGAGQLSKVTTTLADEGDTPTSVLPVQAQGFKSSLAPKFI